MRIALLCRRGVATNHEFFKRKAFTALGHDVVVLNQDLAALDLNRLSTCDLFVTAKAPLNTLRVLKEQNKVSVMWHNDFCSWTNERLVWMQEAIRLVDSATLSDGLFARDYSHAHHDFHGLSYDTPTKTPRAVSKSSHTIFAGGYNPDKDAARLADLQALLPQETYGLPYSVSSALGARWNGETGQAKMAAVYNGNVGLSPVRDKRMQFCTSNRPLLITGGNGLLYAEAFPGCESIFSDQQAIWYTKTEPYKFKPEHVDIQRRGFEHVWATYSWPAVTARLLGRIGL